MANGKSLSSSSKKEVIGIRTIIKRAIKNHNLNPEQIQQIKEISVTNVQDLNVALNRLKLI